METTSNSLIYKANKTFKGQNIFVTIRLNDECKNGHQDFSITGEIYEAGEPKIDKYCIMAGCVHDEILKAFPEFEIFVRLHLCDYMGNPMHPVANMIFHMQNGFNNAPAESPVFKAEFCEYYRITPEQFDVLNTCKNHVQYYEALQKLGIPAQWKTDADKAIKYLEELTGVGFVVDSKRTQMLAPTPEQIEKEHERQANGYYTPEAEAQREREALQSEIAKLEAERDKVINKATEEFEVKKQVLVVGGKKALDNCIYYTHTRQLSFNWRGYDKISNELVNHIIENIQLPEGVTIKNEAKAAA